MEIIVLEAAAAERIGVSVRQARNLATAGDLLLVAPGVVDAESVSAYIRDRGVVARRVWVKRRREAQTACSPGPTTLGSELRKPRV